MTLTKLLAFSAPLTIPLSIVLIARIVTFSAGVPWTPDWSDATAGIALCFGAPTGAFIAAIFGTEVMA